MVLNPLSQLPERPRQGLGAPHRPCDPVPNAGRLAPAGNSSHDTNRALTSDPCDSKVRREEPEQPSAQCDGNERFVMWQLLEFIYDLQKELQSYNLRDERAALAVSEMREKAIDLTAGVLRKNPASRSWWPGCLWCLAGFCMGCVLCTLPR